MKIIKIAKKHPLACWIIFLILLKTILENGLLIYAIPSAIHDDALMIDMAENLLAGQWLGPYDNRRLVKGITFPFYLALNHLTGVPYFMSLSLLYGAACALLTKTLARLIRHRGALALFFTSIYFVPAAACVQTTTRVYRNGLLPALTVILFAGALQMYFHRAEKQELLWSLFTGVMLAAFWNLREDSIWMLPTVLAVCLVTAVGTGLKNREKRGKWFQINLCWAFVPLLVLYGANTTIKAVNQQYYGVAIRNELQEGGFPDLMRAIYSVEPEEDIDQVSVPKSTVDKIYQVSPTFARLQQRLDSNFDDGWDATDGMLDGQIHDMYFSWCLRDCIVESGMASNAAEASLVCEQMAEEIKAALKDGRLPKRGGPAMPSALMSPWRRSYVQALPKASLRAFWATASHLGCNLAVEISPDGAERFEAMTRNLAAMKPMQEIELSGWVISLDDRINISLAVGQENRPFTVLEKTGGEDVFEAYAKGGMVLENAHNCRFWASVAYDTEKELWLYVLKDGTETERLNLTADTVHGEGNGYTWHLDEIDFREPEKSISQETAERRTRVLQKVNRIYQRCGTAITAVGLLCYCLLTAQMLLWGTKKHDWAFGDSWLVCSGLLGSVIVLCVGVAYTEISAFLAIDPLYLSGGYPLITAFSVLSVLIEVKQLVRHKTGFL